MQNFSDSFFPLKEVEKEHKVKLLIKILLTSKFFSTYFFQSLRELSSPAE